MDFIEVASWFLGGALSYSIMSKFMGYYHAVIVLSDVTEHLLKMIGTVVEDVSYIRAMKYDSLSKMEIPEEEIENIMKIDEKVYYNWKTSIILKLISNYPRNFRYLLTFHSWDGAMEELDKIYKKESR